MEMFTTALFSAMLVPLMLIGAVPLFIYGAVYLISSLRMARAVGGGSGA